MAKEYRKGEHVCYGTSSVCLIEDVCEMSVGKDKDTFYVLRPLYDRHSTFYIPVHNDALTEKIREPVSRREIDAMIEAVRRDKTKWIDDRKERMEAFRLILRDCDPLEVLRLCATLYRQKHALAESGKKMAPSDESVLKQAEDLTKKEFGFSLKMAADDAGQYIMSRLR